MKELVSIIMPCYNYGAFVGGAINSVLSQTYKNWELLVIDDGSTDDTIERVEQFDDSRIRLIPIDNAGVSVARNAGLDAARGQFLAFLDADDLWDARKIELQMNIFSRRPDVGFVFSDFSRFDDGGSSYGNFLSFCPQLQMLVQKNCQEDEIVFPGNAFVELSALTEMPWYPTANMVRSSLCLDIRFTPDIRVGEDVEFFARLWMKTKAAFINKRLAWLRIHGSNASKQERGEHNARLIKLFENLETSILSQEQDHARRQRIGREWSAIGYIGWRRRNLRQMISGYSKSLLYPGERLKTVAKLILRSACLPFLIRKSLQTDNKEYS